MKTDEITQDGESVPIPADLRDYYEKWTTNIAPYSMPTSLGIEFIERIGRAEAASRGDGMRRLRLQGKNQ